MSRPLQVSIVPELRLESGQVLRGVRQAYHLDGAISPARDNLVIVFHALTGSADAAGDWWPDIIGPGGPIDTDRYAVLCPNLLGSCYGTTGPWEAERRPFPEITPRDMVALVAALVAELEIRSVELAIGSSLGGMLALEWAAASPAPTRTTVAVATPAAHTALGIAWNHVQRRILDSTGPEGLEIARALAMLTYRTGDELEARFGRALDPAGVYQVERYLDHHGTRLRSRFDAHSYRTLLAAMDRHDVGRGRGGIASALGAYPGRLIGVGIAGDRLYPPDDVRRWVEAAGAEYLEIRSTRGHDAFLLEPQQITEIVADALCGAGAAGVR